MTQRKRATGFALMDTAFAADAKFVRLARRATDPVAFAAAVGVFWLILADARRARSADVNWEDYTEYSEQIASLREAKLLTSTGFDRPIFDRWAPAYRAPQERERTRPYPSVPERNGGTPTSVHINSSLNGGEGAGEGDTFMGWKPKRETAHMGQHPDCLVCEPLRKVS